MGKIIYWTIYWKKYSKVAVCKFTYQDKKDKCILPSITINVCENWKWNYSVLFNQWGKYDNNSSFSNLDSLYTLDRKKDK